MSGQNRKDWGTLLGLVFAVVTSGSLMKAEGEQPVEPKNPVVTEPVVKEEASATEKATAVKETLAVAQNAPVLKEEASATGKAATEVASDVECDGEKVSTAPEKPQLIIRFLASMKQHLGVMGEGIFKCLDWRDGFYAYEDHNWFVTNFFKVLDWTYKKITGKPLYVKPPFDVLRDSAIDPVKRSGENLDLKSELEKVRRGACSDDDIASWKESLKKAKGRRKKILEQLIKLEENRQKIAENSQENEKLIPAIKQDIEFLSSAANKDAMLALLYKLDSGECTEAELEKLKNLVEDDEIAAESANLRKYVSVCFKRMKHTAVVKEAEEQIRLISSVWEKEKERSLKEVDEEVSKFAEIEDDNNFDVRPLQESLSNLAKKKKLTIRMINECEKVKKEHEKKLGSSL